MRRDIPLFFLLSIALILFVGCGGRPGVTTSAEASAAPASSQASASPTTATAPATTPTSATAVTPTPSTISPVKSGTSGPGPQTAWMVVTLPNQAVTPGWQGSAPDDCVGDPSACAQDNRFWEEWDFSRFRPAIDRSFASIAQKGNYQGVMLLMPLADSSLFWNNLSIMFNSATAQGLQFQAVLFPKGKYGPEQCYLYADNAPGGCDVVSGTSTAVAYQKTIQLMSYVENLGSACSGDSSNRPFAIWYGWDPLPGYDALKSFWDSLPTKGCNLQASYITWLDTMYSAAPEVAQLQSYVVNTLNQPYRVNTELYGVGQIQDNYQRYMPYQTIITGFFGANDTGSWASGMCDKWKLANSPSALGVWNFADRDVFPVEQYASLIGDAMANANTMCSQ